jgi:lipopolysaccharide export system permease protein
MIGRTLALYFAGRFAKMVLAMFIMFVLLIAAISYFELVRKVLQSDNYDALRGAAVVLLRVPSFSEYAVPFAALFGSIAAFVIANRRLEVVVVRAAGISAWQFLLPATLVGLTFGVLATTVYNPIATTLRNVANTLNASIHTDSHTAFQTSGGPVWLRQAAAERESIIGAAESFNSGLGLTAVTVMVFDRQGQFIERVDAGTARYSPGEWLLANATVTAPGRTPTRVESYRLPTLLGPDQVRQTFENTDGISFWGLPGLISTAENAGVSSDRYRLRYNSLLAQPILLLAMVLIAAIVSLRFSRSKDLGQMILAGIGVGFVLYVITKIARDLGGAGIVPAPLAAWLPAIVATLIGITVLLHLEDG